MLAYITKRRGAKGFASANAYTSMLTYSVKKASTPISLESEAKRQLAVARRTLTRVDALLRSLMKSLKFLFFQKSRGDKRQIAHEISVRSRHLASTCVYLRLLACGHSVNLRHLASPRYYHKLARQPSFFGRPRSQCSVLLRVVSATRVSKLQLAPQS